MASSSSDDDFDVTDPKYRLGVTRRTAVVTKKRPSISSSSSSSSSSDVSSSSDLSDSEPETAENDQIKEDPEALKARLQREYERSLQQKAEEQMKHVEFEDPLEASRRQLRARAARTQVNRRNYDSDEVVVEEESELESVLSNDSEIRRIREKKQRLLAAGRDIDDDDYDNTKGGQAVALDEDDEEEELGDKEEEQEEDGDGITIKFAWKTEKISMKVDPNESLGTALEKFIAQLPESDRKLKFTMKFDGERIKDLDTTPAGLGMESGDQIDIQGK